MPVYYSFKNTQKFTMTEVDIYENLDSYDLGEDYAKLKEVNEELTRNVRRLENEVLRLNGDVKSLKGTQELLTVNMSELFNTAKCELERKDKCISSLRREMDDLIFKRKKNVQKPPEPDTAPNPQIEEMGKRKAFTDRREATGDRMRGRKRSLSPRKDYRKVNKRFSPPRKRRSRSPRDRSRRPRSPRDGRKSPKRQKCSKSPYRGGSNRRISPIRKNVKGPRTPDKVLEPEPKMISSEKAAVKIADSFLHININKPKEAVTEEPEEGECDLSDTQLVPQEDLITAGENVTETYSESKENSCSSANVSLDESKKNTSLIKVYTSTCTSRRRRCTMQLVE